MNSEIFYLSKLKELKNKLNVKSGQLKYIFEYLEFYPNKFIKQGDILLYCDNRRNQDTNGVKPNYKDNSRQIEILRREKCPNSWQEKKIDGELWIKFDPHKEIIIKNHLFFKASIIKKKLEITNHKCEITGLNSNDIKLSADHWISRFNHGDNDISNCIIMCKYLNEQKNNLDPIDWFCKTILTNFLNICKRFNSLKEVKHKMIQFIIHF